MATIINASNSTGLTLTSDLSGTLQFQNNGVNLPMSGIAPAFSAYANAVQSVTSGALTKVTFGAEDFDTANCFASSTFTPTVAGYYQLNAVVRFNGTSSNSYEAIFYKNGAGYAYVFAFNGTGGTLLGSGSVVMYLNGSTDYVEIYADVNGTGTSFSQNNTAVTTSRFSGCLVRGA